MEALADQSEDEYLDDGAQERLGIILSKRSSLLIYEAISYSLHLLSIHTDSHYTVHRKWNLRPSTTPSFEGFTLMKLHGQLRSK